MPPAPDDDGLKCPMDRPGFFTRRKFLGQTAVAASALLMPARVSAGAEIEKPATSNQGASSTPAPTPIESRSAGSASPAAPIPPRVFWYQRPLRVLQTVLREPDAQTYDAAAVVAYMQTAACNTLVVNAGGIVDFFQNPLPCANINRFMGPRDLLREISEACRSAGIRVIARVDFRGVEEPIFKQHPDWFSVDEKGLPQQLDYTTPKLYTGCYNSYYRNEHSEEFIAYLLEHYAIDGIWHNSIAVTGICYCPRCTKSYLEETGEPLPHLNDQPAKLSSYMAWKVKAADRHVRRMRAAVKRFGPEKSYSAEVFGGMFSPNSALGSGIDLYNARDHFDIMVATAFLSENEEVIRYEELFHSATLVRLLKSMAPEKEALILYGDNGTSQRYIVDPMVDTRVWLWEALSVGGHFWNCGFTGKYPEAVDDRRGAHNSAEAYRCLREHEVVFFDQVPVANVGIYYSRATRDFYRTATGEHDSFGAGFQGMETMLVQNHFLYDLLADDQLDEAHLRRYRVLLLPNVRCLSDREVGVLRRFVDGGGQLVATYATSLHDGNGQTRADFGLADVFGARFTGQLADTRKDCYQFILEPQHPLVSADSPQTDLLLNAASTLLCHATGDAEAISSYVPKVNNQPPEKAWVPSWNREYATMIDHRFGQGRAIYFANQPDQITFEFGHQDAIEPLARAVRLLLGDENIIATNAPSSVHIALTRGRERAHEYILSFVNTTSAPTRPLRNLIPVSDLEVSIRLPSSTTITHQILRSQGPCTVEIRGSSIAVKLKKLEDFCAIRLVAT